MDRAEARSRREVNDAAPFAALPTALREALGRRLNRLIDESTPAKDLARELEGLSFALEVEGPAVKCVLVAHDGRLALEADAQAPTAILRATPLDLLALARRNSVASLRSTSAEIRGDLQVAEKFAELLKFARPDLEEELARWIGDLAAHEVGRAARGFAAWLKRAGAALAMNSSEYLQEESRALPAALEAQAFYGDVERLRDDVERAAARLARLEQRIPAHAPPQAAS
jgi:ubiquinone biosynthesis accessory factor UbiJ